MFVVFIFDIFETVTTVAYAYNRLVINFGKSITKNDGTMCVKTSFSLGLYCR